MPLTISQHWFRKWLGARKVTSYYLSQWWPIQLVHILYYHYQKFHRKCPNKINARFLLIVPNRSNSSQHVWLPTRQNTWWRHQMETFSALLALCAGNSPVTGEFPAQRPVTRNFDVFFDLRLSEQLSKQLWGWWFETPSCPLWCHCNGNRSVPFLS